MFAIFSMIRFPHLPYILMINGRFHSILFFFEL